MTSTVPAFAPTRAALLALALAAASPAAASEPPAPTEAAPAPPTAVPPRIGVEEPDSTETPVPEAPRFHLTLRGLGETTFRANLDDSPGDVAVHRLGAGIGLAGPLSERMRLNVNLDVETLWYDFSNATGIVPGTDDPISEAYRVALRPQLIVIQSRDLSWFVGGTIESAGEYDADFGETFTYGVAGGVRYRINDEVALSFGLAAKTRLEDSSLFIPLIGFEWKLSDTVTLSSDGLGATLAARLSDEWWFNATGGLELRDYRLDDDGPLPSGVLRDARFPVGVGFAYRPNPAVSIEVLGGAVVYQRYTVNNDDGNELSQLNTDPTGFLRLSARITF